MSKAIQFFLSEDQVTDCTPIGSKKKQFRVHIPEEEWKKLLKQVRRTRILEGLT